MNSRGPNFGELSCPRVACFLISALIATSAHAAPASDDTAPIIVEGELQRDVAVRNYVEALTARSPAKKSPGSKSRFAPPASVFHMT